MTNLQTREYQTGDTIKTAYNVYTVSEDNDFTVWAYSENDKTYCMVEKSAIVELQQPTASNNTVGFAVDGSCYCLDCSKELTDENNETRPITFGHTDWSYGSIPICDSCHCEIVTINE